MAKRQFAVIGLGRFGSSMASTLVELGQDVVGIDTDEAAVTALADRVPHVLMLNAMDGRALADAGVGQVDVAVVSIGTNVEASLLIVMAVKELGVKFVMAKATTAVHGRILERLGVDRVVYPEREMAQRLAHGLVIPNVIDYIGLSDDVSIVDLPAPAAFAGQTLREIGLRAKYGVTLIAIKRRASGVDQTIVAPSADERIRSGDVLTLVGANQKLRDTELFRDGGRSPA
jgi:trk system potassium uptake protein TrkA